MAQPTKKVKEGAAPKMEFDVRCRRVRIVIHWFSSAHLVKFKLANSKASCWSTSGNGTAIGLRANSGPANKVQRRCTLLTYSSRHCFETRAIRKVSGTRRRHSESSEITGKEMKNPACFVGFLQSVSWPLSLVSEQSISARPRIAFRNSQHKFSDLSATG